MRSLPVRLENLLKKDQGLHGAVLASINSLYQWLYDNKTPFFPEYTDHSLRHLEEVLFSADSIISDDSWKILNPEDAASIVIAVLLHDCAMHLSEEGFYQLINGGCPEVKSNYVKDSHGWALLWSDYMAEARRFDGKKLKEIFGDDRPVRDIPENKVDLTLRDRLLIGEFVRRHHARLAHEIAFNGVPGFSEKSLKLIGFEDKYLDLFGFIARSHNMNLREAVECIGSTKRRLHYNVHVPFIMLVLRVADYIQIHSERAPNELLKVKGLLSPVSKREWSKHSAVKDINNAHDDPEALYVDADPKDAFTFVALKSLLSDIQSELDGSWSVLGEIYGRFKDLNCLGVKIRRIRSNLDNVEEFVKINRPDYIPKLLNLKTADAEMLELLVSPLYGDNPSIGVRELVQNAVDACVELDDLVSQGLVEPSYKIKAGVSIALYDEEGGGKLVIEDNGVGMTIDVVENYFLNIGASFRNSDLWKKEHETNGKSNIHRSGRFGIGLLAAYLLGDEIEVTTRSAKLQESEGLNFRCKKGGLVEIKNCSSGNGTRIEIKLPASIKEKLLASPDSWDWFCLAYPKVTRCIVGEKNMSLGQRQSVPNKHDAVDNELWRRVEVEGFDDLLWAYHDLRRDEFRSSYGIICNGFIVSEDWYKGLDGYKNRTLYLSPGMNVITAAMPTLVVFDQDGRMPLNLERTGLLGDDIPFKKELARDVAKKIVEHTVADFKDVNISICKEVVGKALHHDIPGLSVSHGPLRNLAYLIICQEGLLPLDFHLMKDSKVSRVLIDLTDFDNGAGVWTSDELVKQGIPYLPVEMNGGGITQKVDFLRECFGISTYGSSEHYTGLFVGLPVVGYKVLLKRKDAERLFSTGKVPRFFWSELSVEWESDNWQLYEVGKTSSFGDDFDIGTMCAQIERSGSFGFVAVYFDWNGFETDKKESVFYKTWLDVVGETYLTH
jgi:hypothetical protein